MRKLLLLAAISAVPLMATAAPAAVIYDGGAPNHNTIYFADTTYAYTEAAESFTLAAGANTVGDVHWWGGCSPGTCPTGDFTLSFYTDNAGSPGALVNSYAVGNANQTDTGAFSYTNGGYTEYAYSTTIAPLTLTPGTTYWLGISNTTDSSYVWGWETTSTGAGDGHAQRLFGSWTAQPDDLAFFLTSGVVAAPEPASLALLGGALAGFGLLRRRGKRA